MSIRAESIDVLICGLGLIFSGLPILLHYKALIAKIIVPLFLIMVIVEFLIFYLWQCV